MNDGFTLLDARAAQAFLKALPSAARRKGEELFRMGCVQSVNPETPGSAYFCDVLDDQMHRVDLYHDRFEGWEGNCSCAEESKCCHVFSAMSALLAEHRTATVRSLSSSSPRTAEAMAASRPKQDPEAGSELTRRLIVALDRNLKQQEKQYIATVHSVYLRSKGSRRITIWDLQQMGFRVPGYGWDGLKIWPVFPANEHEFWLYVANCALGHSLTIPEFMLPITDLEPIQKRLAQWERSQAILDWTQKLAACNFQPQSSPATSKAETDLRLVIGDRELRLQRKPAGQTDFEYLKQGRFRAFGNDYDQGLVVLTNEAEVIWQFFTHLFQQGMRVRYSYFDTKTLRMLGRLLRMRQLDSRIVNWRGEPLARPIEPLRWELQPALGEKDDYSLRLVKNDGTPAPQFLSILPGRPALYLNEEAVYTGPSQQLGIVDPSEENRIPAPALEAPSGVEFLRSIGVELPARIREQLQMLPYQVAIDCQLKPIYLESNTEECIVSVLAEATDGTQQTWTGEYWTQTVGRPPRKEKPQRGTIKVYDRASLEPIPALLEPLNLKSSSYSHALAVRVTKKFPEVFAAWVKTVPSHIILRLGGELASLAGQDVAGRVTLDATEAGIDWFDLRVVLDVSDTTLLPGEIKALLNAKGGYVRLEGKGWRRLRYDLSQEEDERLARLGLSPRELTAEPQRLHALQLADDAARKFLPEQQVAQIQRRVSEIKTRVSPDLPEGVTAQLRPYQLHGFHFLAYLSTNRFGGILADDMGLGKTLQTLAWLLWLRKDATRKPQKTTDASDTTVPGPGKTQVSEGTSTGSTCLPCLVVCPKSVMDNWKAEAERFTPGLRVKLWPASELQGFCQQLASADLHVLNYSQLRLLGDALKPVRWLAVILDEGQYIKNPNSQTAQTARALSAEHRLILSGTPIENRLLDLWSLMGFAMPGVLGSRAQFARLHDAKGDPFARSRLAARVRPFVLRRTKNQVAKDLPDRIEEDLFCEIEGEQQLLYRAELKRAQQLLLGVKTQQELAKQQFHFLTSLLRLRQICCDPRLIKADCSEVGAKTEALLDLLEPLMEEGQKVLVFSQFVEMLNLLRPALAERNWPLFSLTGETENRGALVEEFQKTEGPAVFLISLKAGGFGLNLTAASYVVLFDPWWNPAVENQAIDRTHRIGQTNKVIAYRLLIKKSIEEKIRELQKQKKALAQDVLGEEKFAQSLTLNDLHFLFSD